MCTFFSRWVPRWEAKEELGQTRAMAMSTAKHYWEVLLIPNLLLLFNVQYD